MGTFQRTETIDARQFTGGEENGENLALWVNCNGQLTETRAEWCESVQIAGKTLHDRVRVRSYNFHETAFPDYWIILKQNGDYAVMSPEEFLEAGYVQV